MKELKIIMSYLFLLFLGCLIAMATLYQPLVAIFETDHGLPVLAILLVLFVGMAKKSLNTGGERHDIDQTSI
jgi:hypothetical protein